MLVLNCQCQRYKRQAWLSVGHAADSRMPLKGPSLPWQSVMIRKIERLERTGIHD